MKKQFTPILFALAVIMLMAGCKGKDKVANDPKVVLTAFFERMAKKDMDGAAKFVTKDSKSTMDMMKKAMTAAEQMKGVKTTEKDPSEDFANMEFGEAKIDGETATVAVKNTKKNTSFDFPLKKEDGAWKVDFSMATLMKMGMEQAGKENGFMNGNNEASDTTGMSDKMNNFMNADSMKKGLEQLDSALKNLDPEKMKQMKDAMKELEKLKNQ